MTPSSNVLGPFMKRLVPLLFLASATAAFAQNALTLEDCLAEAARKNPSLAASRSSVEKAQFDRKANFSGFLPQLSANAGSSRNSSEGETVTTESDSASYGVSAKQTLFAGGRNKAALDQGSAALASAEADLASNEAQITYEVRQAFAELLYAQEQLTVAREIEKRQRDNVDMIELRYEGGRENKGNLLRTKATLREAEYGTSQAERNLRVARRQLAKVLGRKESEAFLVSGDLKTGTPGHIADMISLAEMTPDHRKAMASVDSSKASLKSAKSQYYPDLAAVASAGRRDEDWMPEQDEWTVGVALSYPFFPGGRSLMEVRSAGADLRRAEQSLESTDAGIVLSLEQAFANYEDAAQRTEVEASFLEAAQVRAEIARTQYASGLMSFEDWDRIESELTSSQKSELLSRRLAVLAQANWEKTQGVSLLR